MVKSVLIFASSFCLAWCGMLGDLSAALQVASYDADVNERLNGSANFIGAGYDWSGVGQTSDGRWVTMISDEYFISVGHYHRGGGGQCPLLSERQSFGRVRGLRGEHLIWHSAHDGPGPERHLDRPSDLLYKQQHQLLRDLRPLPSPDILEGEDVFVVGNSGQGSYQNFRVGTNVLDLDDGTLGVAERSVSVVNGWSATAIYDADVLYDTFFQSGDSGAPTFIVNNGVLELVGVHSVAGTITLPGGDEQVSIDSLVSGYRQEILGLITPVPEPAGMVLVWGACMMLALRRRRPVMTA
ncbi:hypothetical protein [Verrucomicrobium spinosum]|uniref:hypothetical protein n=1 Tax=Verrucomicrobium spinosum TaxID=2736 RepID=UPI001C437DF5|nr:hypothetical protein [Verrucomicrobium spinosum]